MINNNIQPMLTYMLLYIQEQSSRKEVCDLERRLCSSEALVADFQKSLQQRDSELEALKAKVTTHSAHECWYLWSNSVTVASSSIPRHRVLHCPLPSPVLGHSPPETPLTQHNWYRYWWTQCNVLTYSPISMMDYSSI